ncbi:hypothetical protein [Streptomyces sp. NRRL S-31]|uniref:hypothetical protein n=1 Tax=Streptomyces sp. NRRL S-31 TaxID=1463898 RepID=UPI00069940F5|nr:hypothetical protein [Streptomyces sp. NRRL S-31]
MSRSRARLAGVVAAAAAFTVGCSPPGDGREQDVRDPRPLSASLVTSVADTGRLRQREEAAVADCMARRGYTYVPQRVKVNERAVTTNPYGLLREEQARRDGYGAVGEILGGPGRNVAVAARHSVGWTQALEGTRRKKYALPTGVVLTYRPDGCVYQGREAAYGPGWNRLEYELEGLQAAVMDRVERDGRYKKALASWSACMRKRGHPYDDLQDPRRELAGAIGRTGGKDRALRALGRRELRTAADDYACERDARLHEAVYEAQRSAQNSLLDSSARADIRRYRALKRSALARKASIPVKPR